MAKHDVISRDCEIRIADLLLAGNAIEFVAVSVGVSHKSVAVRKAKLKRDGVSFGACACGRPATHRGMCAHRHERFRAKRPQPGAMPRVRDLATWAHHLRRAKNIRVPKRASSKAIYDYVKAVVPRTLPTHIYEDVCGELLLALTAKELKLANVVAALPDVIRRVHEIAYGPFSGQSFDDPVPQSDGSLLSLAEIIADSSDPYDVEDDEDYISPSDAIISNRRAGFVAAY